MSDDIAAQLAERLAKAACEHWWVCEDCGDEFRVEVHL
jgi:hypothetical protein